MACNYMPLYNQNLYIIRIIGLYYSQPFGCSVTFSHWHVNLDFAIYQKCTAMKHFLNVIRLTANDVVPYELVRAHARIKPTCSQSVVLIFVTQCYEELMSYVFMNVLDEKEIIFSALTQMLEFILQSYFLCGHFLLEKKM